MLNKNAHYIFNFCIHWSFPLAKMAVARRNCMVRFCYVTTQKYRMYLAMNGTGLHYAPYIHTENQWVPAAVASRVPEPDVEKLFKNVTTLEQEMKEAFFLQFPEAEMSFYDSLPSYKEVKSVLERNPTGMELTRKFYLFTRYDEISVEDADGIIDILVNEGVYSIPYVNVKPDWKNEIEFQMYRGKLHPESWVLYLNQQFWEGLDVVVDKLRGISWGSFRQFIDRTIQ